MKNLDLYEVLGVDKKASITKIKKAYYDLSKIHHPDKNNGRESQEFINITTAYSILKDKAKRKEYDRTGKYDTQVYSIRKAALDSLAKLLLDIVKNRDWDFEHSDLFEIMKLNIEGAIRKLTHTISELTLEITRMELIIKRISGKDSLFGDMIKSDIEQQTEVLNKTNQIIEVASKALSILKEYKYDWDPGEVYSEFKPVKFGATTSTTGG